MANQASIPHKQVTRPFGVDAGQMATATLIAEDVSLAFRELLFSQLNRSLL
jgi:hypothetical protein